VHHAACQRWFESRRDAGFRTCPLTEAGFVRISSNPAFSKNAVSPAQALALLRRITAMPEHDFWPADLRLENALASMKGLSGHRQVTDAYLLALAQTHDGNLATLDRGFIDLAPDPDRVEIAG
jgi:toxin-antitoxin system PIN domain toxin